MIDISLLTGTSSQDGLGIYRKHHLYAVLLETLADRQYCMPDDFFDRIVRHMNEEIKWNATVPDISAALLYLGCIGMIEAREEDNNVRITAKGMSALEDCRFQQLAASAFFNYRGMKNNELGIIFASFSLIVSLAAFIVSSLK